MKPTTAWPQKSALVLSQSPHVAVSLKELLRSLGWQIVQSTAFLADAVSTLQRKEAFLLIVDDSLDDPAVLLIRQLQRFMVGLCTPTFVFLQPEQRGDTSVLTRLGYRAVGAKPLIPADFVPAFRGLLKLWETPSYRLLQEGALRYLSDHDDATWMALLQKIQNVAELKYFVVPALALLLKKAERLDEAERLLIQSLRQDPQNLRVILSLGDLYVDHAMPEMARRLYLSADKSLENSCFLLPELVQIAIMQGNFEDALLSLEDMRSRGFMPEKVEAMMARLYFSQGQLKEAESLLAAKKGIFRKMLTSWGVVSREKEKEQ